MRWAQVRVCGLRVCMRFACVSLLPLFGGMRTHTQAKSAQTHARTQTNACTYTRTHTHTHTIPQLPAHPYRYSPTRPLKRTQHKDTHAHTKTHTQACYETCRTVKCRAFEVDYLNSVCNLSTKSGGTEFDLARDPNSAVFFVIR